MDQDLLRQEQTRLIKIVEAFDTIGKSKEWEVLKELVFSKSLESIERQMRNECLNQTLDTSKLYRLQGEWAWAKQFCDTDRFTENIKKTLEEIKKKL